MLSNGSLGSRIADKVLPPIFRLIYLKRTASSIIQRPPELGGDYMVRSDIPPYVAYTVGVKHRAWQQAEHNLIYSHHLPHLFRLGAEPGSRADVVDSKTNRCLDPMRLRTLCHASFCPVLAVLARALPGHRNTVESLRHTIEGHTD